MLPPFRFVGFGGVLSVGKISDALNFSKSVGSSLVL